MTRRGDPEQRQEEDEAQDRADRDTDHPCRHVAKAQRRRRRGRGAGGAGDHDDETEKQQQGEGPQVARRKARTVDPGTAQQVFSVFCRACANPRPPMIAPRMPIVSDRDVALKVSTPSWSWISSPMIGNSAKTEFTSLSCSAGYLRNATPRMAVNASNSGKVATKP